MSDLKKLLFFFVSFAAFANFGTCFTIRGNETAKREKIIGGLRADIKQAPYFVQVFSGRNSFCGGALLTRKHVLTARHCIQKFHQNPEEINVLAGSDSLQSYIEARKGVKLHFPANSLLTVDRDGTDIAIITVNEPFRDKRLKTVQLTTMEPQIGDSVVLHAMGTSNINENRPSKHLQEMTGRITECVRSNSKDICMKTSDPAAGICSGDSGSPLINAQAKIVGIASRFNSKLNSNCASGFPDYYASVNHQLGFIMETIREHVNDVDHFKIAEPHVILQL